MAPLASISSDIGRFIYELRQGINGIVGGFIFGSNLFSLGLVGMTASTRVHGDRLLKSEVVSKNVHIRIPAALWDSIQAYSTRKGETASTEIRRVLFDAFQDNGATGGGSQ